MDRGTYCGSADRTKFTRAGLFSKGGGKTLDPASFCPQIHPTHWESQSIIDFRMHLILTGATGLVGSAALNAMINMPEVSGISVLSRRPVKMAEDAKDPRINIILHHDFTKYGAEVLAQLKGASGLVWALGTGQNAVSRECVLFSIHAEIPSSELTKQGVRQHHNHICCQGSGGHLDPRLQQSSVPIRLRIWGRCHV